MVFPELPLLPSRNTSLGCTFGIFMERKWIVLEDNLNIIAISIKNLLEGRTDL